MLETGFDQTVSLPEIMQPLLRAYRAILTD